MKVTLINKEETRNFYKNWGLFACKCYDTPKHLAENVGKKCHKTRHYSGSRAFHFIFEIEDVPRSAMDQLARHEQGVIKNIQSQRYTDSSNLGWYIPDIIEKYPDLKAEWKAGFKRDQIDYAYFVEQLGIRENWSGEKAREVARGRLGMDIYSSGTIGFTIEALEHFMHKRLCFRAQEAIRKLANLMKEAILEVMPELAPYLVADCFALGYCPENDMQCSQFADSAIPTKDIFDDIKKTKEFKQMVLDNKAIRKAMKEAAEKAKKR